MRAKAVANDGHNDARGETIGAGSAVQASDPPYWEQKILDRQARKYLGMSGEEFIRKYRAGEIEDPDRTEVLRVSILIPMAER